MDADAPLPLEGYLWKKGDKGIKTFKKRYFVLKQARLYYYEKEGDPDPISYINLGHCKEIRPAKDDSKKNKGKGLELVTDARIFHLQASSPREMEMWLTRLVETRHYHFDLRNRNVSNMDDIKFIQAALADEEGGVELEDDEEEEDDVAGSPVAALPSGARDAAPAGPGPLLQPLRRTSGLKGAQATPAPAAGPVSTPVRVAPVVTPTQAQPAVAPVNSPGHTGPSGTTPSSTTSTPAPAAAPAPVKPKTGPVAVAIDVGAPLPATGKPTWAAATSAQAASTAAPATATTASTPISVKPPPSVPSNTAAPAPAPAPVAATNGTAAAAANSGTTPPRPMMIAIPFGGYASASSGATQQPSTPNSATGTPAAAPLVASTPPATPTPATTATAATTSMRPAPAPAPVHGPAAVSAGALVGSAPVSALAPPLSGPVPAPAPVPVLPPLVDSPGETRKPSSAAPETTTTTGRKSNTALLGAEPSVQIDGRKSSSAETSVKAQPSPAGEGRRSNTAFLTEPAPAASSATAGRGPVTSSTDEAVTSPGPLASTSSKDESPASPVERSFPRMRTETAPVAHSVSWADEVDSAKGDGSGDGAAEGAAPATTIGLGERKTSASRREARQVVMSVNEETLHRQGRSDSDAQPLRMPSPTGSATSERRESETPAPPVNFENSLAGQGRPLHGGLLRRTAHAKPSLAAGFFAKGNPGGARRPRNATTLERPTSMVFVAAEEKSWEEEEEARKEDDRAFMAATKPLERRSSTKRPSLSDKQSPMARRTATASSFRSTSTFINVTPSPTSEEWLKKLQLGALLKGNAPPSVLLPAATPPTAPAASPSVPTVVIEPATAAAAAPTSAPAATSPSTSFVPVDMLLEDKGAGLGVPGTRPRLASRLEMTEEVAPEAYVKRRTALEDLEQLLDEDERNRLTDAEAQLEKLRTERYPLLPNCSSGMWAKGPFCPSSPAVMRVMLVQASPDIQSSYDFLDGRMASDGSGRQSRAESEEGWTRVVPGTLNLSGTHVTLGNDGLWRITAEAPEEPAPFEPSENDETIELPGGLIFGFSAARRAWYPLRPLAPLGGFTAGLGVATTGEMTPDMFARGYGRKDSSSSTDSAGSFLMMGERKETSWFSSTLQRVKDRASTLRSPAPPPSYLATPPAPELTLPAAAQTQSTSRRASGTPLEIAAATSTLSTAPPATSTTAPSTPVTAAAGQVQQPMVIQGTPYVGTPVAGTPVAGTPVTGRVVTGTLVTGTLVSGTPVTGSPLVGTPIRATTAPVSGSPVTGSPVVATPASQQQPSVANGTPVRTTTATPPQFAPPPQQPPRTPAQEREAACSDLLADVRTAVAMLHRHFTTAEDQAGCGNDATNRDIAPLVRKDLCTAIVHVLLDNFKEKKFLGTNHMWDYISAATSTDTLRALEFHTTAPGQTMQKAYQMVHGEPLHAKDNNMKVRSFICSGLNQGMLDEWFQIMASHESVMDKYFERRAFLRSPSWLEDFLAALRPLSQLSFRLSMDYEPRTIRARAEQAEVLRRMEAQRAEQQRQQRALEEELRGMQSAQALSYLNGGRNEGEGGEAGAQQYGDGVRMAGQQEDAPRGDLIQF